jgi:hypothetical protein
VPSTCGRWRRQRSQNEASNRSMKPTPKAFARRPALSETLIGLLRHPAVTYLFFVRHNGET